MTAFPDGFRWGAATAAHQVEGGNWNNDWWAWEHDASSPCAEPSGDACDHYHRYPDDIRLLADLGFNTYRFSLEWSRIEPEDGEFSAAALDHYGRMIAACRDAGVEPVPTLHHFTTPRWVAAAGGWSRPATADRFVRFTEVAVRHLGAELSTVCTINEPNMVATMGYLTGIFPPGDHDPGLRAAAIATLVDAHRRAARVVRSFGRIKAGLTLAMSEWVAVDGGEEVLEALRSPDEDVFLEAARGDDFIGVQTYTRTRVGPKGPLGPAEEVETTLMGYEFWPEALEATVRRAWDETGGVPVFVTENGVATANDARRVDYIERALGGVLRCLESGIDVMGYLYWSLLDNFEWALGYGPTFGLVAVDRRTQQRTVKPSARRLGAIARDNRL